MEGGGGEDEQCFELKMQPSDLKLCFLWPRALQNDASLRHGFPHLELEMNYDHDILRIKSDMIDSAALPRLGTRLAA